LAEVPPEPLPPEPLPPEPLPPEPLPPEALPPEPLPPEPLFELPAQPMNGTEKINPKVNGRNRERGLRCIRVSPSG
jgi:hypothetical protein